MLPLVIARVLYTRYCALELSTRIFASIQRLARAVHIELPERFAVHRLGARSPHRKRVAIVRHEFHPQYRVALATPSSGTRRSTERVSASPSLIALVRGTMVRSAVLSTQRPSPIAVLHAIAPIISAVVPIATAMATTSCTWLSSTWFVRRLRETAHGAQRTLPCARLLEAA